jgi:hypothetical protein
VIDDIHAANGLVMVFYWDEGGWSDTAGSLEFTSDSIQHENYITNEVAPWTNVGYVPFHFVIDLQTRNVLGKDSDAGVALTPAQIVALVQDNNI